MATLGSPTGGALTAALAVDGDKIPIVDVSVGASDGANKYMLVSEARKLMGTVYGALITKSGSQALTTGAGETNITWSAVTGYNVTGGDVWTSGDNTKIYVPSGFSYAEVLLQVEWSSGSTLRRDVYIKLNGSSYTALHTTVPAGTGTVNEGFATCYSGIVAVTGGTDYFLIVGRVFDADHSFNTSNKASVRVRFFT